MYLKNVFKYNFLYYLKKNRIVLDYKKSIKIFSLNYIYLNTLQDCMRLQTSIS